jgi:hypothetical protein
MKGCLFLLLAGLGIWLLGVGVVLLALAQLR